MFFTSLLFCGGVLAFVLGMRSALLCWSALKSWPVNVLDFSHVEKLDGEPVRIHTVNNTRTAEIRKLISENGISKVSKSQLVDAVFENPSNGAGVPVNHRVFWILSSTGSVVIGIALLVVAVLRLV